MAVADAVRAVSRATVAATRATQGLPALPEAQVAALHTLRASPSMTPAELAERLGLARPTVSNLLRDLEAAGHVTRARSEVDRRSVILTITEQARTCRTRSIAAVARSSRPPGPRSTRVTALPWPRRRRRCADWPTCCTPAPVRRLRASSTDDRCCANLGAGERRRLRGVARARRPAIQAARAGCQAMDAQGGAVAASVELRRLHRHGGGLRVQRPDTGGGGPGRGRSHRHVVVAAAGILDPGAGGPVPGGHRRELDRALHAGPQPAAGQPRPAHHGHRSDPGSARVRRPGAHPRWAAVDRLRRHPTGGRDRDDDGDAGR